MTQAVWDKILTGSAVLLWFALTTVVFAVYWE